MTMTHGTTSSSATPYIVQVKKRPTLIQYSIHYLARFLSVVSPSIAANWLISIFSTPQKYRESNQEKNRMLDCKSWLIQFNARQRIPLYSWGQGPIILLVHGLSGRASQMGEFVQPLLEKGYRVVAFDTPAHGNADGKHTVLPEIAEAVQKVADHLGPLKGIIAHSIGAAATSIALSQSIKVEKVVNISSPEDLSGYLIRLARVIGFSRKVSKMTQEKLESQSGFSFEGARGLSIAPHMDIPALFIHDEKDRLVPFEEGARLAKIWPGAQLEKTVGLGHSRILRNLEVIAMTTAFLVQDQNTTPDPLHCHE